MVAGLALGLVRELLIVARWGTSGETDALLVALFIPEAIRTAFGSGLISAAATNLWLDHRQQASAGRWLGSQHNASQLTACTLAVLLTCLSAPLVRLIAPGMAGANSNLASEILSVSAWCLPGLFLQSLLAVVHQADHRFALPGLGSLCFNLPPVLYLLLAGPTASATVLAGWLVVGSLLMAAILVPHAYRQGWRPFSRQLDWLLVKPMLAKLLPLGTGAAASQATILLERVLGSMLPEGSIALLNLARKLLGLPAVAITSLGQVALSRFANDIHASGANEALGALRHAVMTLTIIAFPIALGLAIWAPQAAVLVLLGKSGNVEQLADLIRLLALSLVPSGVNAVLARYRYAHGDTRGPTFRELLGTACQLIGSIALFPLLGLTSLPWGATLGILTTSLLLFRLAPAGLGRLQWIAVMFGQGMLIYLLSQWLRFPVDQPSWLAIIQAGTLCLVLWGTLWPLARRAGHLE